jgi:predicted HD superfamily hydrolase involved in NAD metabolism
VCEAAGIWCQALALSPQDTYNAILAALLHDNAKQRPADELKAVLNAHHYPWHDADVQSPAIWHAWAGAIVASSQWGITTPDVLNAIHYHTTGRPHMGVIEMIVYVADKTEARTRDAALVDQWQQQVATMPGNHDAYHHLLNWMSVLVDANLNFLTQRPQPKNPQQHLLDPKRLVHPNAYACADWVNSTLAALNAQGNSATLPPINPITPYVHCVTLQCRPLPEPHLPVNKPLTLLMEEHPVVSF